MAHAHPPRQFIKGKNVGSGPIPGNPHLFPPNSLNNPPAPKPMKLPYEPMNCP